MPKACSSIKSCSTCCKKTRGCWKLQAGLAATGGSAYYSRIRYALTGTRTLYCCRGRIGHLSEIKPSTLPQLISGARAVERGGRGARPGRRRRDGCGGSIGGGRRTCDVLVRVACGACRQCGRPSQRPAPSLPSRLSLPLTSPPPPRSTSYSPNGAGQVAKRSTENALAL